MILEYFNGQIKKKIYVEKFKNNFFLFKNNFANWNLLRVFAIFFLIESTLEYFYKSFTSIRVAL